MQVVYLTTIQNAESENDVTKGVSESSELPLVKVKDQFNLSVSETNRIKKKRNMKIIRRHICNRNWLHFKLVRRSRAVHIHRSRHSVVTTAYAATHRDIYAESRRFNAN